MATANSNTAVQPEMITQYWVARPGKGSVWGRFYTPQLAAATLADVRTKWPDAILHGCTHEFDEDIAFHCARRDIESLLELEEVARIHAQGVNHG